MLKNIIENGKGSLFCFVFCHCWKCLPTRQLHQSGLNLSITSGCFQMWANDAHPPKKVQVNTLPPYNHLTTISFITPVNIGALTELVMMTSCVPVRGTTETSFWKPWWPIFVYFSNTEPGPYGEEESLVFNYKWHEGIRNNSKLFSEKSIKTKSSEHWM